MTRIAWQTAIVIAALAGAYVLWELASVVVMFVLSLALAAALRPPAEALARRGVPRSVALVGLYLSVVAVVAAVFLLSAGLALEDVRQLGVDAYQAHKDLILNLKGHKDWREKLASALPQSGQLEALLGIDATNLVRSALGVTMGFVGLLANAAVVVVLSLYWSVDRVHFERLWLSLLPVERRIEARQVWRSLEDEVGAYIRSESVQALVAGAALTGGYALLGQPYAALSGILAGVAWLLPWVGVLAMTATLVLLSVPTMVLVGPQEALLSLLPAVLFTLLVLIVLEYAVEPRFFNRRRFNPLLIAIVTIGLAELLGLPGLVLGPPLAIAVQCVARYLIRRRLLRAAEGPIDLEGLERRLRDVKLRLAGQGAQSRELTGLVARLDRLVEEAAAADRHDAAETAAIVVSPN
ncbi:MAG: AI-2E family transporter [Pirellulales bacterium]